MLKCCLEFLSQKAVMCLTEKIHVLDELPLGVRYSAVGHEFSVTESTVDIKQSIFKQKHTQNKVMY